MKKFAVTTVIVNRADRKSSTCTTEVTAKSATDARRKMSDEWYALPATTTRANAFLIKGVKSA